MSFMLLLAALGVSDAFAEYTAIRAAYRALPRFAYTAVTYNNGREEVRAEGNAIVGVGFRLDRVQASGERDERISTWKQGEGRYHVWHQTGPERVRSVPAAFSSRPHFEGWLQTFRTANELWNGGPWMRTQLPLVFIESAKVQVDREWGLPNGRIASMPDIQIEGKTYRRLVIGYPPQYASRVREVLTYDPSTRLLRDFCTEFKSQASDDFAPTTRTIFRYRDATKLTREDVVRNPQVPMVGRFALKPSEVNRADVPTANLGETAVAVIQALKQRYLAMESYRDAVEPTMYSKDQPKPARIAMALDRKAGGCIVRQSPFDTMAEVGLGAETWCWQTFARDGYFSSRIGKNSGFMDSQLTGGAALIRNLWHGWEGFRPEGSIPWRLRNDQWKGRPMRVLVRTVYRPDFSQVPRPPQELGTEEVWVDEPSGLIVRSRNIPKPELFPDAVTFEAEHRPEPNVQLTANDLKFTPPKVNALQMVEAEWTAQKAKPRSTFGGYDFKPSSFGGGRR